jgi:hypothetical protein
MEQLLLLAAILLLALLDLIARAVRKSQAGQVPQDAEPGSGPIAEVPRPEEFPVPARPAPPRAPLPAPVRRPARPSLGPGDARRGIVLMTILGPCRGLDPR